MIRWQCSNNNRLCTKIPDRSTQYCGFKKLYPRCCAAEELLRKATTAVNTFCLWLQISRARSIRTP